MPKREPVIEVRKGPQGDSAFIAGTRVRVADIAQLYRIMSEQVVIERIMRSLPTLTEEQVAEAISYWRAHDKTIEEDILEEQTLLSKIPIAG